MTYWFQKPLKTLSHLFFESVQDALIYICDDNDKKGLQRFTTFDRWYIKSSMTDYITKLNNVIEFDLDTETNTLYTSLMFHKENPNCKNIEEAFNSISNTLNGEKP